MDSIDKLLAQLETEYKTGKSFIQPSSKSASLIDNILAEVKADFIEQDAALELKRQEELEQQKIQQQQLKAQQKEALKQQAQAWLSKLDPFSPEGLWFERFAEGYPSKLDAAIEYLQIN